MFMPACDDGVQAGLWAAAKTAPGLLRPTWVLLLLWVIKKLTRVSGSVITKPPIKKALPMSTIK